MMKCDLMSIFSFLILQNKYTFASETTRYKMEKYDFENSKFTMMLF